MSVPPSAFHLEPEHVLRRVQRAARAVGAAGVALCLLGALVKDRGVGQLRALQAAEQSGRGDARQRIVCQPRYAVVQQLVGFEGAVVADEVVAPVVTPVHLGGALGLEAGFGRKVRGLKVTSEELPDYVERVLRRFQEEREDGERFATWVARAGEESLS